MELVPIGHKGTEQIYYNVNGDRNAITVYYNASYYDGVGIHYRHVLIFPLHRVVQYSLYFPTLFPYIESYSILCTKFIEKHHNNAIEEIGWVRMVVGVL